ncbi:MAG TPA: hypothetical protein VME44_02675 [Streptosporangiaceae bacterium]|nr:hypothetical protein [Streptosporangiaceae bacterium]
MSTATIQLARITNGLADRAGRELRRPFDLRDPADCERPRE